MFAPGTRAPMGAPPKVRKKGSRGPTSVGNRSAHTYNFKSVRARGPAELGSPRAMRCELVRVVLALDRAPVPRNLPYSPQSPPAGSRANWRMCSYTSTSS